MVARTKNGEDSKCEGLDHTLTYVSPTVYCRRLTNLRVSLERLMIKPTISIKNQLLRDLEFKKTKLIKSLIDLSTHLEEICVFDVNFRYSMKLKKQEKYRVNRRSVQEWQISQIPKGEREERVISSTSTAEIPIISLIDKSDDECEILDEELFKISDISIENLNVAIEDIDISIFDIC